MSLKMRSFDIRPNTKKWLRTSEQPLPLLSSVRPTEFPKGLSTNFVVKKLIGHQVAHQSIIKKMTQEDKQVSDRVRAHVLFLIERNKQVNPDKQYPDILDVVSNLSLSQCFEVYDGLLANFIGNFSKTEDLQKIFPSPLPSERGKIYTAEEVLIDTLTEEAQLTGFLLKSLDLFGLERPKEVTALLGPGQPPADTGELTDNLDYWLKSRIPDETSFPNDIAYLLREINFGLQINMRSYRQIYESGFAKPVADNHKRPSSSRDDIIHEIHNLIERCKAIDDNPEHPFPSLADVMNLEQVDLINLYWKFGLNLIGLFEDPERSEENASYTYYGNLNAREFLISTLSHLHLHAGSLEFMRKHFKQ